METPGHVPDHLAFSWQRGADQLALFSGDTLFNAGVGNCKSAGASVEALFETTNRLKKMPNQMVLYPGHDYVLKNLLFAKSCEPENKDIDEALKMKKDINNELEVAATEESHYPYKLGASVGEFEVHGEDHLTLQNAIEKADDVMYEIKKAKKHGQVR